MGDMLVNGTWKMRHFRSGRWHWHFCDEAAAREMAPAPERWVERGKLVHHMRSCGCVYKTDDYYFKWEKPKSSGLAARLRAGLFPVALSEFRALRLLNRENVPVVPPVAYGVCGSQSMLITREVKESTVLEYLVRHFDRRQPLPDSFLRAWSVFLAQVIRRKLYLADSHCGNLFYQESTGRFIVVDPGGVKKQLFLPRRRLLRMLKRQFASLFEFAPKATLLMLLSELAPEDPEKLYRQLMAYNAEYVRRSCMFRQKRLKELRRGSSTRLEDGVERKFSGEQRFFSLEHTEKLEFPEAEATELWERDFVFGLYRLPVLRIVGRAVEGGVLYRQEMGTEPADGTRRTELLELLDIAGLRSEEFGFCTDRTGRTVLFDRKYSPAGQARE